MSRPKETLVAVFAAALVAGCLGVAPAPALAADDDSAAKVESTTQVDSTTKADDAADTKVDSTVRMFRLYNPYTGEHFYTGEVSEKDDVVKAGWNYEGIGWVAPASSKTPVYRLYNPYVRGGDHHYTTDKAEYDRLVSVGWRGEGVKWYSDDAKGVPVYRQYNPYATTGTHNFTANRAEHEKLVSLGWKDEKVAWHAITGGTPYEPGTGTSANTPEGEVDPVYVTSNGKEFHRESCPSTTDHTTTKLSRIDALHRNYDACKVCKP